MYEMHMYCRDAQGGEAGCCIWEGEATSERAVLRALRG